MMALLDKPESPAVQNLLQEIAMHYPEVCSVCNKSLSKSTMYLIWE